MRNIFLILMAALLCWSCHNTQPVEEVCVIEGNTHTNASAGDKVYLCDAGGQMEIIDSLTLTERHFRFEVPTDSSRLVSIFCNGRTGRGFIKNLVLEPGTCIRLNARRMRTHVWGSPLNAELNKYQRRNDQLMFASSMSRRSEEGEVPKCLASLVKFFVVGNRGDLQEAYRVQMVDTAMAIYNRHHDDALAACMLTDIMQYMTNVDSHPWSSSRFDSILASATPAVRNSMSVQSFLKMLRSIESVAAGSAYHDFVVQDAATGSPAKLSQVIGGHLAIVQFWSCQCWLSLLDMPDTLNVLHRQYAAEGLKVVGVDVWADPDSHQEYMSQTGMEYPQLLDPLGLSCELYGHNGLQFTLLIGPDGIILGRYGSAQTLRKAVDTYMSKSCAKQ